jgi:hypothetical protein
MDEFISHWSIVSPGVSQVKGPTYRDVSGGAQQEVGEDGEEGRVESIDWSHGHKQGIGQA